MAEAENKKIAHMLASIMEQKDANPILTTGGGGGWGNGMFVPPPPPHTHTFNHTLNYMFI